MFVIPQERASPPGLPQIEMQRALSSHGPPSAPLLRFLRTKIEKTPFFHTNTTTSSSRCPEIYPASRKRASIALRDPHFRSGAHAQEHPVIWVRSQDAVAQHCQGTTLHSNLLGGLLPSKCLRSSNGRRWPSRGSLASSQHISKRSIWKRGSGRKSDADAKARELPPLPSFLDDTTGATLGRAKAGKPGSELKLRCTEIDESGNVITVNGEFKKSELIAKVGHLSLHQVFPPKLDGV